MRDSNMPATSAMSPGGVVNATAWHELLRMRQPGMQAVIVHPPEPTWWEREVGGAVCEGRFVVARQTMPVPRPQALVHVLEQRLPTPGIGFESRLALIDDIALLADTLAEIAGCQTLMLRLFTETPTRHCGFHVDTVTPGSPPFGLLKVYNGTGTSYVDAGDVTGAADFYTYLGRRERVAGAWRRAEYNRQHAEAGALLSELCQIDARLAFLRPFAPVHKTPPRAAVAFRHVDSGRLWDASGPVRGWIHASPMEGTPRLVVNITPLAGRADRWG